MSELNENDYSNMSTREYMSSMAQKAYEQSAYAQTGYAYEQPCSGAQSYYRNESGMEDYTGTHKKKAKNKKGKRGKTGAVLKRGVAIVVSAALFGGVAGGVFNAVSGDRIEELREAGTTEAVSDELEEAAETVVGTGEAVIPTVSVESDGNSNGQTYDVSDIAKSVMPSIVAINIKTVEEVQNFFGQVQQYEAEGSGSGIIIGENDTELLIVTNNHVVSNAENVSVCFIDNEVYEAKVKSTDSENDLAIVVVELKDLSADTLAQIKVAKLGSSDDLEVGEQVVAIGNALGYGQSVTTGIVSAKDRETEMNATPLIQTDAAINPGNSGGALLNMQGEVIGINSSKYSSTDVEGMCYAIPISAVEDVLNELINRETREKVDEEHRGYLGISCGTVSEEASEMYGIPVGVLISEVFEDSGAEEAGLKKNYIITKFDGQTVESAETLTALLEYYAVGEKVEVTYMVLSDDEYVEKTAIVTLGKKLTQ